MDKIWAFSNREMYGTGDDSGYTIEGLGNDGHGYSKFVNLDSKYFISSYSDSKATQRCCYDETGKPLWYWLRSPVLQKMQCSHEQRRQRWRKHGRCGTMSG